MVNTLRFPLSIIRVFADEWLRATGCDMHAVSLKGSLIGRISLASGRAPSTNSLPGRSTPQSWARLWTACGAWTART